MYSDATSQSPLHFPCDRSNPSLEQSKGDNLSLQTGCLMFNTLGTRGALK